VSSPSATARAPARARTPYEAGKTSRDPGRLFNVAVDLATGLWLTVVDKSQVFALRLSRRKFAKNPIDLNRCKFSIDAGFPRANGRARRVHHFETIPDALWKPRVHHSQRMGRLAVGENPADGRSLAAKLCTLAFA
jgi:hypothetical protein